VDTSKLSDAVETISQEILNIKEKIKSYEADLQTAKQMGDKQEVKLLREDIRTEKNLLIELQKKENLLIANANIQGYYTEQHFRTSPLSLSLIFLIFLIFSHSSANPI
jgi:membrane-bound lytic murein transglycosylase MltF